TCLLRGRGAGRCGPLAAGLLARPAARAAPGAAEGDVLAVGLAGAGRQHGPGPGAGPGAAIGIRIRAGPRAVPPAPAQPLAGLLARGGAALLALPRRTRLFPGQRRPAQGTPARPARLSGSDVSIRRRPRRRPRPARMQRTFQPEPP